MLARDAGLGVVQPQVHGGQRRVIPARGCGQEGAQCGHGLGRAGAIGGQQLLGLFLEMAHVGPGGDAFHRNTSVRRHRRPASRLHKGM